MVDYGNVAQVGCAILTVILIGFFTVRYKFFPFQAVAPLNRFLLDACFFSLLARSIASRKLGEMDFLPAVVGVCANLSIHALLLLFFVFPFQDRFYMYVSSILPVAYINYLIIGIPVFNSIWPPEEGVVISVMTLSNDIIVVPIYLVLANIYNIRRTNEENAKNGDDSRAHFSLRVFLTIGLRVLTNPIVMGNIFGYIWAATGWPMIPFLSNLMEYLANAVLGLSLFSVGGFLAQTSLIACHWAHFLVCLAARHIAFPGFVAVYSVAFGLTGRTARQAVLMSCCPSAAACYFLSDQAGIGPGVSSTMIFWSTFIGIPMQALWLFIFDTLNWFPEA